MDVGIAAKLNQEAEHGDAKGKDQTRADAEQEPGFSPPEGPFVDVLF